MLQSDSYKYHAQLFEKLVATIYEAYTTSKEVYISHLINSLNNSDR